jgi:cytochrome c oxidase subunit 3
MVVERETEAAHLGMWLFLASEVFLFGALFAVYTGCRVEFAADFARAAHESSVVLGTVNTFVLLTSSLLAALAVQAAETKHSRRAGLLLLATIALGAVFMVLKLVEYAGHAREGLLPGVHFRHPALATAGGRAYFTLYYLMTGLHGLHVLGGMTALGIVAFAALRGRYESASPLRLELVTLYWHLVDVVWIFLWPLFYLVR